MKKEFKEALNQNDLRKVQDIMYHETCSGYQVYNPFVFPVEPMPNTLVCSKIDSLKYERSMFEGLRVADLGCSMGFFSFYALGFGAKKVTGYDNRDDYVIANNQMADNYGKLFPNTKGKISFKKLDLSNLPKLEEEYDAIIVNSLIHWFIMFKKATFEESVKWMFDNTKKHVYFEGCVDSTEAVMTSHGVDKNLMDKDKFIELCKKYFSKVEFIGKTSYNEKRIVLRMTK